MSAYEKTRPAPLHSYDPTQPFQNFSYAASPYTSQSQIPTTTATSFQNAGHMTHMEYASNPARSLYDEQSGPYLNVGSTPVPQVTSYSPQRATGGSKFCVYISSLYDLTTTTLPTFFLMFGSRKCHATLKKMSQQGAVCQYAVTTDVPPFVATGWQGTPVPVSLLMESGDAELMCRVDVGDFTYVIDGGAQSTNSAPMDMSRKRKMSNESIEEIRSPAKRISNNQLRPKEEYNSYGFTPTEVAPYSPYLQPGSSYGLMTQYGRAQQSYQTQAPPRNLAYQYATSTAPSPPTIKAGSPGISTWSPGYQSISSNRSPGLAHARVVSRPSLSGFPSPNTAQPPLIRTSTLQQTPSPGTTPASGQGGQTFNPYALYPHKAVLKIQGDLDAMAENWSAEEWDSKRRLVHFQRTQSGSTITTTFKPVAIDSRPPQSVCISCIWWEEKNECFVTSVDTIYLLEQLVAVKFTVEEKNRIRRNLEGFRPLTVSKAKAESEEFFKVIMAFPNPKPRNIEKDVKVFPWKILSHALKKIIGKYSASPSSTLPPTLPPALLTPVSSSGYMTESHSTSDYNAVSPRSVSGSTTSTAYCASNSVPSKGSSHALSPHTQQAITAHAQGGGSAGALDLRVAVPSYGSSVGGPGSNSQHGNGSLDASNTWQASHHMATGSSTQYQQLANPGGRASWDLTYPLNLEPGAVTVGAGAVPQPGSGSGLHSAGVGHGLSLNSHTLNAYSHPNNHSRSPSSGAITSHQENRASLSGQSSSNQQSHQSN